MKIQASFMAALIVTALTASAARASLTINLRFADGSTTHTLTAADVGTDIEIDVWATITGQNPPSSTNFYGLQYVYYSAVSSLPNGAGTGVNGAIDASANALTAAFNANGSQVGVTQDINGDGVADVGSRTDVLSMDKPRGSDPVAGAIFDDNTTAAKNALPDGYEFEVEKLFFHVNSLADGETDFTAEPENTTPLVAANWFQDAPTDVAPNSGIMNGAYSGGTTVRLIAVPEPAGLAALLAIGSLLMRRRDHSV